MPDTNHHVPSVRLAAGEPPPAHYYAVNVASVIRTVARRYADLLHPDEAAFGQAILELPDAALRLYARLLSRKGPLIRLDSLAYVEVGDMALALARLQTDGLVELGGEASASAICALLTNAELDRIFALELAACRRADTSGTGPDPVHPARRVQCASNGEGTLPRVERAATDVAQARSARRRPATRAERFRAVLERVPEAFIRWRVHREVPWVSVTDREHLDLYRLLFFGDRHQDLTTFVLRDLGFHRFEAVTLCTKTRQFASRAVLDHYLALDAMHDEVTALGNRPSMAEHAVCIAGLIERLAEPLDNRLLERRRSRLLNRLGRNVERGGASHCALRCYALSTLPPARERRMRVLKALGEDDAVEELRQTVLERPQTAVEADFARRFGRRVRRRALPTTEVVLAEPTPANIEQHALDWLLAGRNRPERASGTVANAVRLQPAGALGGGWENGCQPASRAGGVSSETGIEAEHTSVLLPDIGEPASGASVDSREMSIEPTDTSVPSQHTGELAPGTVTPSQQHVKPASQSLPACIRLSDPWHEQVGAGWHLENNLPMALFGLAYWSWVFAPIEGAFLHPFQTGPTDLFWPDFFAVRQAYCSDPLLGAPLRPKLRQTAAAKVGVANRLFNWHRFRPGALERIIDTIPEADLARLIDIVRADLPGRRTGFPDLTVIYDDGRYEFVEVKGPNDQVQAHQRLWIEALEANGLPVRVLRFRLPRTTAK